MPSGYRIGCPVLGMYCPMPNWGAMTFRLSLSLPTTSKPYRSPGGLNGCLRRNFATEQLYEVLFAGGLPARYLMHAVTSVLSQRQPTRGATEPSIASASRRGSSCHVMRVIVCSYPLLLPSAPHPPLPNAMRCAPGTLWGAHSTSSLSDDLQKGSR